MNEQWYAGWLETLDKKLKDRRDTENTFGWATILLSGDFRQTLSVLICVFIINKFRTVCEATWIND